PEEEAAVAFLTVGRHQDSRTVAACRWHKGKGDEQRENLNILHNKVGRSGNNLITRDNLGLCHINIKVRMVMVVAGGIASVLEEVRVVIILLGPFTHHIAFALGCNDVLYYRLFSFEVVLHPAHRVLATLILKYRQSLFLTVLINISLGKCQRTVNIEFDIIRLQFNVKVTDPCITVEVNLATVKDYRVLCTILNLGLKHRSGLLRRIGTCST